MPFSQTSQPSPTFVSVSPLSFARAHPEQNPKTRLPFSPSAVKSMPLVFVEIDWACGSGSTSSSSSSSSSYFPPSSLALLSPGSNQIAVVVGSPCAYATWSLYRGNYLLALSTLSAAGAAGVLFIEGVDGKLPEQMLASGVPSVVPTCIMGSAAALHRARPYGDGSKAPASDPARLLLAMGVTYAASTGAYTCQTTLAASFVGGTAVCSAVADFSNLRMYKSVRLAAELCSPTRGSLFRSGRARGTRISRRTLTSRPPLPLSLALFSCFFSDPFRLLARATRPTSPPR